MRVGNMKLVEPTVEFDKQIREYRKEFLDCGDPMEGASRLKQYDDPQEWIEFLNKLKDPKTVPQGRVPLTQYMFVREEDQKIVGMINIRHSLNAYLERCGGHIGISIVPSERHKGYATQMLKMALSKCREFGINKVLYAFNSGNEGSKRIVLKCGGTYESDVYDSVDRVYVERYWINLSE